MPRRTGTVATLAPLLACALVVSSCATMKQTVEDNPKAVLMGDAIDFEFPRSAVKTRKWYRFWA